MDACLQKQSVADIISAQVTVEKDIGADPGKLLQVSERALTQNLTSAGHYSLTHTLSRSRPQVFLPWTPTANTPLLPGMPFHLFQANQVASTVPYAIGTVQNEGLLFVYEAFLKPVSKLEFDVVRACVCLCRACERRGGFSSSLCYVCAVGSREGGTATGHHFRLRQCRQDC